MYVMAYYPMDYIDSFITEKFCLYFFTYSIFIQ